MKAHHAAWFDPKVSRGQFRYEWATEFEEAVVCILDYEPSDGDGWHLPVTPANATLCEAWIRGLDIAFLLSDAQVDAIEIAALEAHSEQCQHDEGEYRWEQRQEG